MYKGVRTFVGAAMIAAAFGGCLFPNEATGHLTVALDAIPRLTEGDTVSLTAHVMNGSAEVPNSQLAFSVANPSVATVSSTGTLVAIDSGSTIVIVSVVGLAGVTPTQANITVHSRLEVDSIAPTNVAFGDSLTIFGAGLDPASIFSVQVGGFSVPTKSFVADNPANPNGPGRLTVWVTPPAPPQSLVQITTNHGARLVSTPVSVAQQDVFEPNEEAPASIPVPFFNPGLSLELPPAHDAFPNLVDWYTFTLDAASDVSVKIHSAYAAAGGGYTVVVSDSLFYDFGYYIGLDRWAISNGYGAFCRNEWLNYPLQLPTADAVFALGNLPAGTYHLWLQYQKTAAIPQPYQLDIATSYRSTLPPDAYEENDYCEVAKPLGDALTSGGQLTIDTPFDIDWFKFTTPAGGSMMVLQTSADADTSDIDLYLYNENGTLAELGLNGGQDEVVAAMMPPGHNQLMVADYAGAPTNYTLSAVRQEAEPNNHVEQADTITLTDWRATNLWGQISSSSDTDYVAVYAEAGKSVEFWLRAGTFDSPLAPKLVLRDSAGTILARDDEGGYSADIWYDVPTTGWYRLAIVRSAGTATGADYFWVLQTFQYDYTLGTPRPFASLRTSARESVLAARAEARKHDAVARREKLRATLPASGAAVRAGGSRR